MRVTTNTMMRQYNGRLGTVLKNLNAASDRVATSRKYNKASQDPSSSVRGTKTRREYLQNDDYLTNLRDVKSRTDSVESSMMNISKVAEDAYVDVLTAINGTIDESQRGVIADKLREMQKTLVRDMNASEGGEYIFGGTSTKEIPFKLDETTGILTYRGIDVNTEDPIELAKLDSLANQKIYIDLGFGLTTDANGEIDPNSAYNMAMPGVNIIGYGKTDGSPNNLIVLLGEIANTLDKPLLDGAVMQDLSKQLDTQRNNIIVGITKLGSDSMFLDYTSKRLENNEFNYNQKLVDTELISPDKAITDFKMQDYVYRATLKIGMDILKPSFIDFMN